jgi:hypothetical protein
MKRKTVLSLFATATAIRTIVALLQFTYGINASIDIDRHIYGNFNPGLELYSDFYAYYGIQLKDLSHGLVPYLNFAYSYPPLFLYTLYSFFIAGGIYFASIPIVLADACTSPLVYLIVKRFSSERVAFMAGLAYALSPFFLLYEAYLWLSSQPMTFFLLLSFYLLIRKQPLFASVALAISVLFKQEAIFLLPVFLIWWVKDYKKGFLKPLFIFSLILIIVSLPFLMIAPSGYITSVSFNTLGDTYVPPLYNSSNTVPKVSSSSLICFTQSTTWRNLLCHYGNFTYTDVKSIPPWTVIFSAPFLNTIAQWISFALFAISLYYFVSLRKNPRLSTLIGSFILTCAIALFDVEIHTAYRYYLVPVYALILATSINKRALLISVTMPIVSLLLPSGSIQITLAFLSILLILLSIYLETVPSLKKLNNSQSLLPDNVSGITKYIDDSKLPVS